MKKLFIILILFIPLLALAQQKPDVGTQLRSDAHPITQGLQVYWPVLENSGDITFDRSRYDRHGTLTGGALWGSGGIRLPNSAGNSIDWIDDPKLEGTNITAFTLFADIEWGGGGDNYQYVIGKNYTVYQIYIIGMVIGRGNIGFTMDTNSGPYDAAAAWTDGYGRPLYVGERIFLAVTWDSATDTITFYCNGVQVGEAARTGDYMDANANLFCMGKRSGSVARDFYGTIYQGGFFNRACSPAEIQQLYADRYVLLTRKSRAKIMYPNSGAAPAPTGKPVPPKIIIISERKHDTQKLVYRRRDTENRRIAYNYHP